MKRSSKGSSEKSSNGDESPNHSDESESPQRLSQSGTPTLSNQMTAFQSDNNSSPSIEIIPSNEEQVRYIKLSPTFCPNPKLIFTQFLAYKYSYDRRKFKFIEFKWNCSCSNWIQYSSQFSRYNPTPNHHAPNVPTITHLPKFWQGFLPE